jgi:hypothetical protein
MVKYFRSHTFLDKSPDSTEQFLLRQKLMVFLPLSDGCDGVHDGKLIINILNELES